MGKLSIIDAPETKPEMLGKEALDVAYRKYDRILRKYETSADETKFLKKELDAAQEELNIVVKDIIDPKAMPLLKQEEEE